MVGFGELLIRLELLGRMLVLSPRSRHERGIERLILG
jgi:hypothetical protein